MCSENISADSFAVTAKLICTFVFAQTKFRFSHDADHMELDHCLNGRYIRTAKLLTGM